MFFPSIRFFAPVFPSYHLLSSISFFSLHFISFSHGVVWFIFSLTFPSTFALLSFLFPSPLLNPHPTLPILRRETDELGKLFLFNVFLSLLVFLTLPAFLLASSRSVLHRVFFSFSLPISFIYTSE